MGSKGHGEWHTPLSVILHKQAMWTNLEKCSRVRDPSVPLKPEITYFNNPKSFKDLQEYDLFFSYTKVFPLFDPRKPRDNRQYLPDIHENIFQQERDKPVPALTSQVYGRPCRKLYDHPEKRFQRVAAIGDFYRKYGVSPGMDREPQET